MLFQKTLTDMVILGFETYNNLLLLIYLRVITIYKVFHVSIQNEVSFLILNDLAFLVTIQRREKSE